MRARRTELEKAVSECMIRSVIETSPGLRDWIRTALDKGAAPSEIRRRYGTPSQRGKPYDQDDYGVALAVEWIVDEWERDAGRVKATESIDTVQ